MANSRSVCVSHCDSQGRRSRAPFDEFHGPIGHTSPNLVWLLLFFWRFLLGRRRWSFWFSRRRMLRLLGSRRRGGRLGFRFCSWPIRRFCRCRFCRCRMCSRLGWLSVPLGRDRSGLRSRRRRSRLRRGLGGLSCFPHRLSRLCRRGIGRSCRSRSRLGTIRLRVRRRRSRGRSRASGNYRGDGLAFGDGFRRRKNDWAAVID